MADEPVTEPRSEPEQRAETPSAKRSNLAGLVGIVATIVIIVLLFLLLRGCAASSGQGTSSSGPKQIVPVTGLHPLPSTISVWVAQGTTIDTILSAAGIGGANVTNMGGGRFVVAVPVGTEATAVSRLKSVSGVYDAGLVFTDQKQASSTPTASSAASATGATGY